MGATVPGGTHGWYTPTIADSGGSVMVTVTINPDSALPIEQTSRMIEVSFPVDARQRLSGPDRFATNVAVSAAAFPDSAAGAPVAYVASGENYPDALSAGPAAAAAGGDLLLTARDALPASVSAELVRIHPPSIVIVGGPGAVATGVEDTIRALPFHPAVTRIAGVDRYDTSRLVVDHAFPTAPSVYLASGGGFADAVAAGATAAATGRPVLLVDGSKASADQPTIAELGHLATTSVTVTGGPSAISAGVASTLGAGITVDRTFGADRFQTATAIVSNAFTTAPSAYLANAFDFPDALSTAVLAGRTHAPLFLTVRNCVPQATLSAILNVGAKQITLVGGYAAMNGYIQDFPAC